MEALLFILLLVTLFLRFIKVSFPFCSQVICPFSQTDFITQIQVLQQRLKSENEHALKLGDIEIRILLGRFDDANRRYGWPIKLHTEIWFVLLSFFATVKTWTENRKLLSKRYQSNSFTHCVHVYSVHWFKIKGTYFVANHSLRKWTTVNKPLSKPYQA